MKQINTEKLILASASPRRKELMAQAGLEFEIRAADIDEEALPYNGDPGKYARTLAEQKALAIAASSPDTFVIGADTIVVAEGKILGKPKDRDHAVAMLTALNNREHSVYTGFSVVNPARCIRLCESVETKVRFKQMTPEEIDFYAGTKEPYDKAGAYGIQGIGAFMVKGISGSYSNVVGLPVCELIQTLARLNIIEF